MSAHGHEAGHGHSHSSSSHESSGESFVEQIPLFGKLLKQVASVEGIKNFMNEMIDNHILPVALKTFDFIKSFFGGGGGHHAAHAHAH